MKHHTILSPAGMSAGELCEIFTLKPAFRAKQVRLALNQGIEEWKGITTLPEVERSRLENLAPLFSSRVEEALESEDGSAKLLVRLADGTAVETVLLCDERGRKTACLSSQVGCAMACAFCRTGTMGLIRNLCAGEIIEQFYHLQNRYGSIGHIVFMGMGEPLANVQEVKQAISILNDHSGINIGIRKITVSTCGITPGIASLAQEPPYPKLACSLVSADPELREQLMPITRKHPLPELKQALIDYQKRSGRRITLECVLIGGVNANAREAKKVAAFADGLSVLVNIIPWNPADEIDFYAPEPEEISAFTKTLETAGIEVSRRYRRGDDIQGACGQLVLKQDGSDSPHSS